MPTVKHNLARMYHIAITVTAASGNP